MRKRIRPLTAVQAIKAEVRRAEQEDLAKGDKATGCNGFLLLKFREPKVARLIASGEISQTELMAADEITRIYEHLCSGLMVRGATMWERLDRGVKTEPQWFVEAYRDRYLPWARFWSRRKITHYDPTLKIVFDYLFSDINGREIDRKYGWTNGLGAKTFANGLRDYAAMAGWCDRSTSQKWSEMARAAFPLRRMRARAA